MDNVIKIIIEMMHVARESKNTVNRGDVASKDWTIQPPHTHVFQSYAEDESLSDICRRLHLLMN